MLTRLLYWSPALATLGHAALHVFEALTGIHLHVG